MIFNPDGYRSVYYRSACFQDAAILYRDESLCTQVKERWSLFFSSWGYSGERCRKLVTEGQAADRQALENMKNRYLKGAVTLVDFRIERNGNRRDFDIIPSFSVGEAHPYLLSFEIIGADPSQRAVLLHSSSFHLDGNNNIRIFVRQTDVRRRFPRFELGRPYRVQGTLIFSVGSGGQGGRWSDAFIERVFPEAERSTFLEKEITF